MFCTFYKYVMRSKKYFSQNMPLKLKYYPICFHKPEKILIIRELGWKLESIFFRRGTAVHRGHEDSSQLLHFHFHCILNPGKSPESPSVLCTSTPSSPPRHNSTRNLSSVLSFRNLLLFFYLIFLFTLPSSPWILS